MRSARQDFLQGLKAAKSRFEKVLIIADSAGGVVVADGAGGVTAFAGKDIAVALINAPLGGGRDADRMQPTTTRSSTTGGHWNLISPAGYERLRFLERFVQHPHLRPLRRKIHRELRKRVSRETRRNFQRMANRTLNRFLFWKYSGITPFILFGLSTPARSAYNTLHRSAIWKFLSRVEVRTYGSQRDKVVFPEDAAFSDFPGLPHAIFPKRKHDDFAVEGAIDRVESVEAVSAGGEGLQNLPIEAAIADVTAQRNDPHRVSSGQYGLSCL